MDENGDKWVDDEKTFEGEILVVNDDRVQLTLMAGLLGRAGWRVRTFSDAESALESLNAMQPPVLVVTDLYMPGIDGWQFCRLLRSPSYAAFNMLPILVVSAIFPGEEAEQIAAEVGADAFLPVPVKGRDFIALVQKLIETRQAHVQPAALIVEDDHALAKLLAHVFTVSGYEVETHENMKDALVAIQSRSYRVAVLDYHLARETSDALLDMLREREPECVSVMITGDTNPELALQWNKKGAAAYLIKPFEPAYLLELCTRLQRERALMRMPEILAERTKALRESERRYQDLFEKSRDGLLTIDANNRLINANRAFCEMLGYTLPELMRMPDIRAITPPHWREWEQKEVMEQRLSKDGYTGIYEKEYVRKDGLTFPAEVQSYTVFGDDHQPAYYWSVVRNIANRRVMERAVRQAQKMQSVGRLAGGVAHDFNNIIGIILGHAQLAMLDVAEDHPAFESLKEIEEAANRASRVTKQLLTFASREPVKPVSLDLNKTLSGMLSFLNRLIGEHVDLEWSPQGEVWLISIDPGQLDQVIVNLCVNARDAVEKGGNISISTGNVLSDSPLRSRYMDAVAGGYVCLSVTDTGCGMTKDVLNNLFEPFFSTKRSQKKGTGLGLATVYGIVKQNKGFIDVQSEPEKGTVFQIYFPRHQQDHSVVPEPVSTPSPLGTTDNEGKIILLVEDNDAFAKLTKRTLQDMGYTVWTANHPRLAMELAHQHLEEIDLLLTDVVMPEMNGVQLYQRLAEARSDLKVLFMSGYTRKTLEENGLADESAHHYIQKPFSRDSLSRAVRQAMD